MNPTLYQRILKDNVRSLLDDAALIPRVMLSHFFFLGWPSYLSEILSKHQVFSLYQSGLEDTSQLICANRIHMR